VVTVIGLVFSGILGGWVLYAVVFLLAVLTNLTALQRILYTRRAAAVREDILR